MVLVAAIAWFILFLFLIVFQCTPIRGVWDLELVEARGTTCIPFNKIIIAYEVTKIAVDILILGLPTYMVRTLQLPLSHNIAVWTIFLLGGFICIISVIRVVYLANATNSARTALPNGMDWSTAELSVAIICGCLPTFGPLFHNMPDIFTSLGNWVSSFTSSRGRGDSHRTRHSSGVRSSSPGYIERQSHNFSKITGPDSDDQKLIPLQIFHGQ